MLSAGELRHSVLWTGFELVRLAGTERGTAEETLDGIYADPPDEGDKTMP